MVLLLFPYMYIPAHFNEERVDILHQLIREYPLGTLVTHTPEGLAADPIPFIVDPHPAPYGTLRGHVARANPVGKLHSAEIETLVVFQGPQAYITPAWYPAKKEHGKVVPTWNYAVVHAYGTLCTIDDAGWMRRFLEQLTDQAERTQLPPWKVSDAPEDFVQANLRAIVGIEISLTRLLGKWKVSQNRSPEDRQGVATGLQDLRTDNAREMAKLVLSHRDER